MFCTIGYGGRKLEEFLDLLLRHEVKVLVDIRRFPKSKQPEFNPEPLREALEKHGIEYVYLGRELGGFRKGGYPSYMKTREYEEGIEKLLGLCGKGNVALMCKERKDSGCHRRFIAMTLRERGFEVVSIE